MYQALSAQRPDPDAVAAEAKNHGMKWLTAQAIKDDKLLDREWLKAMRKAATHHGLRLGVHGYVGKPAPPKPKLEAKLIAQAIDIADADFAIVNAEIEYEQSSTPDSEVFVDAYRRLKPSFTTYFSSFGRPQFHSGLDWKAWADGGFLAMPQAYENLNAEKLTPAACVKDYARFFDKEDIRPTLGCFSEHGKPHLPIARLVKSVRDVPGMRLNVYRHGTVTKAELEALAKIA